MKTRDLLRFLPLVVLLAALGGAAAVRLSLLGVPLSSDEAGFLRMGRQWSPGRSLYGDYWVSRPPGITAIYSLASLLGGATALRVIGLVAALASAVLAAGIGRTLAPGRTWPAVCCGVLTAALVSTPHYQVQFVDGEILALPFLMAGVLGALRATVHAGSRRLLWAGLAGASGAAALSVKQNLVDVGVVLGGLVLVLLLRRAWRPAVRIVLAATVGAVALVVPLLALAVSRGTSLVELWDAVVMFRFRATEVLKGTSASTRERAAELVDALMASRAPWVLVLLPTLLVPRRGWRRLARLTGRHTAGPVEEVRAAAPSGTALIRRDDPALAWVAAALVLWEAVSVRAGGGYWLHYLVGIIPGVVLVLALSLARLRPGAGWWRWAPRLVVVGGIVAAAWSVTVPFVQDPPQAPADEQAVADYLRENSHLGRTAVVAFGRPTILQAADMDSPYPQLWSVPVLTDDRDLERLAPVLEQQRATWVVTRTDKLEDWGLTDAPVLRDLPRNYERVHRQGDFEVWRARSAGEGSASALARPAERALP